MTREDAIVQLNFMIENMPKEPPTECDNIEEWLDTDKDIRNALEMAIDTLKQETVSRDSYENEYFLRKRFEVKIAKLEKAIQALQQEPSEDVKQATDIDKVLATIDFERKWLWEAGYNASNVDTALKSIEHDLRKCNSENPYKWVPASERLPRQNEYVGNVCKYYLIQDEFGDMQVATYTNNGWIPINTTDVLEADVIAWCSLPKSYQEEKENEE